MLPTGGVVYLALIGCGYVSFAQTTYDDNHTVWMSSTSEIWTESPTIDVTTEITIPCSILDPPEVIDSNISQNYINLTWTISNDFESCENINLNVTCISNDHQWWITPERNVSFSNITTETFFSFIDNLSEFTNYTCIGFIYKNLSLSENSDGYNFTTKEGVPSSPFLEIKGINSTSFDISWEEPSKIPGVLLYYSINIQMLSPNHYVPPECPKNDYNVWHNTTDLNYSFNEGFPDYVYNVTVFGVTSAGSGAENSTLTTTNSAEPDLPEELYSSAYVTSDNGTNVNISAQVSWNYPCNANGVINNFYIAINGKYSEDQTVGDRRNFLVEAKNESSLYCLIEDIMASSAYEVMVRAIADDFSGEFGNITFSTPVNYPGEPIVEDIKPSSSNLKVSWAEPLKNAGKISSYTLSLSSNGPAYIKNPKCNYTDSYYYTHDLSGDQTEYTFDSLEAFFNYNLTILAKTFRGAGPTAVQEITTDSKEPEMPEDFDYKLIDLSSDFDYNRTANLSWSIPCRSNGILKKFKVFLNGTYSEDVDFVDIRMFDIVANNQTDYFFDIENLNASFEYTVKIDAVLTEEKQGNETFVNFTTPVGYPGMASFKKPSFGIDSKYFNVSWDEPKEKRGKILGYQCTISSLGPKEIYNSDCIYDFNTYNFSQVENFMMFHESIAFFEYNISVKARTDKGFGPITSKIIETPSTYSDKIEIIFNNDSIILSDSEEYDAKANLSFTLPCFTNGKIENIEIKYNASRPDYDTIDFRENFTNFNASMTYNFMLQPEYLYDVFVTLKNTVGDSAEEISFKSPAGVPKLIENVAVGAKPEVKGISEAKLTLKNNFFNTDNGNIKYLALLISSENITGGEYHKWNGFDWPVPNSTAETYYQISEKFWYPFGGETKEVSVVIGNDTSCKKNDLFCNRPLQEDTKYYLIIRVFTDDYYKNSDAIEFKTDYETRLGLILGLTFGLLGLALIAFFVFYVWKKKLYLLTSKVLQRESVTQEFQEMTPGTDVPIHSFFSYCKNLEEFPEKVTEQYKLLNERSAENCSSFTTMYALLPENKRKNRYTNILPYDDTRVKLLMDEDDEISSDYINASYIKGYSGNIEYIATQGPMPTTCKDFWKMIIQEHVRIIVMVSQFIEDTKEKCYKYFPNNHENMIIDDNIEIRCSTELHFGTYCVRTLQVKRGLKQETVTHMQFLDWPDFGVPTGTENMLQFCYQLREKLNVEGGVAVVHCSAGVGRTGTLIATDILLQVIKSGRKIDVFKTVLDLRMQRKNMVQTDKQYMYIHKLLRDNIDNPASNEETYYEEPLYENLAVFKKSERDLVIIKDIESKL